MLLVPATLQEAAAARTAVGATFHRADATGRPESLSPRLPGTGASTLLCTAPRTVTLRRAALLCSVPGTISAVVVTTSPQEAVFTCGVVLS